MDEAARGLGDRLALLCIGGYQKHLSPRKGWSCAHRVLSGGPSCSQWVKITISERGCLAAWPLIRARFAGCKEAAQILRAGASNQGESAPRSETSGSNQSTAKRKRPRDNSDCCDPAWPCDLAWCWPSGGGRAASTGAVDAACDCGPADSGCVDCSSCSCWP